MRKIIYKFMEKVTQKILKDELIKTIDEVVVSTNYIESIDNAEKRMDKLENVIISNSVYINKKINNPNIKICYKCGRIIDIRNEDYLKQKEYKPLYCEKLLNEDILEDGKSYTCCNCID